MGPPRAGSCHNSGMRRCAVFACLVVLVGCGSKSEKLPVACTEGYGAIVKALAKAPGTVVIDGITPISKCFNRNASGDDIQIAGTNLLAAAQGLADRARAGDRSAALQLGYLVGAVDRGAQRN